MKSLTDYINEVLKLEKAASEYLKLRYSEENRKYRPQFPLSRLWYRGEDQDYKNSKLTPKSLRKIAAAANKNAKSDGHFEYVDPYREEGLYVYYGSAVYFPKFSQFLDRVTTFEKLIFLQHFGASTRLLDWTLNPLAALFFALYPNRRKRSNESQDHDTEHCAYVYVLNPRLLNRQPSFGKYTKEYLIADEDSVNTHARLAFIIQSFTDLQHLVKPSEIWKETFMRSFSRLDFERLREEVMRATEVLRDSKLVNCTDVHNRMLRIFSTPIAVFPRWLFQRMQQQMSVFTLHGGFAGHIASTEGESDCGRPIGLQETANEIILEPYLNSKSRGEQNKRAEVRVLTELCIPSKKRSHILEELYYLGVNKFTLFSDDPAQGVGSLEDLLAGPFFA